MLNLQYPQLENCITHFLTRRKGLCDTPLEGGLTAPTAIIRGLLYSESRAGSSDYATAVSQCSLYTATSRRTSKTARKAWYLPNSNRTPIPDSIQPSLLSSSPTKPRAIQGTRLLFYPRTQSFHTKTHCLRPSARAIITLPHRKQRGSASKNNF